MTIADKITRSEFLPQNLQQGFEKGLRLEASLLTLPISYLNKSTYYIPIFHIKSV